MSQYIVQGWFFYMSTETQNSQSHKVMLSDRENGEFTGIEKVISAEPEEIICDTSMGRLCVREIGRAHV